MDLLKDEKSKSTQEKLDLQFEVCSLKEENAQFQKKIEKLAENLNKLASEHALLQ